MLNIDLKRRAGVKGRRFVFWLAAVGVATALSACGGGSSDATGADGPTPPATGVVPGTGGTGTGGTGTGGTGTGGTGTTPVACGIAASPGLDANCDMTEKSAVYGESGYAAHPFDPKQITNMSVVVIEPDDPSNCNDGTGDGLGRGTVAGYSGCTLADVDGDVVSDDAFKPEVNVIFNADGYPPATEANAKLSQRGGSARLATLKSYKIKLNKGEPKWRGQRTIQLNKESDDLTRVLNKLAFDLFRTVPDFSSLRTAFVRLDLTDGKGGASKDYGLFTQLEKVDDDWADAHGFDKNADIIKVNSFSFLPWGKNADCSDVTTLSPAGTKFCLDYPVGSLQFERAIESEGKDDTPDMGIFKSMLAAVNDNSPNLLVQYEHSFGPVMQQYFHQDNLATWLATEILTGNSDSVSNNHYLYRPSAMDNYYFVPWDYDKGFDHIHQGKGVNRKITDGTYWLEDPVRHGVSQWWRSPLMRRFIQDGGAQALSDKVDALYQGALSPANVARMLNSYPLCAGQQPVTVTGTGTLCPAVVVDPASTSFIEPMLLRDPDVTDMNSIPSTRGDPNPDASLVKTQWEEEIQFLPNALAQAYQLYKDNLHRPMPMWLGANASSTPGQIKLTWDPSYSVDGRPIVYDVSLSTSPVLSATVMDLGCTKLTDSQTMPEFETAVAQTSSGTVGPDAPSQNDANEWTWQVPVATAGNYYFRVIARDSEGYCQIPFDQLKSVSSGTIYYGVYGFHYDPGATPPISDLSAAP